MNLDVIPLGTASAIPAYGRHLSCTALRREGSVLLFDCGEGTQYQVMKTRLKPSRIDAIFITHFHGDHFYGLLGVLSTLALLKRDDPLTVVGPEGIQKVVRSLPGLANDWLPFETTYVELPEDFEHEVVFETKDFWVEARPVAHRVFTMGFRFEEKVRPGPLFPERAEALGVQSYADFRRLKAGAAVTLPDGRVVQPEAVVGPARPGRVFSYVIDTRPCENCVALARRADLLCHEATFGKEYQARAEETGHSTAREAAEIAREAGAKQLLLNHFSARYDDLSPLVEEARAVFQNTEAAEELKRYALAAVDGES